MAKRRRSKNKRSSSGVPTGITARQYKQLKQAATNTRKRIAEFNKRVNADDYIVPSQSEYTLTTLLNRIESGETVKNVLTEMAGITAANILQQAEQDITTSFGYEMDFIDRSNLRAVIKQANEAIKQAKERIPDLADIFPQEISFTQELMSITSEDYLQKRIEQISKYAEEGAFDIISIPATGEAITRAQYEISKDILQAENERRRQQREAIIQEENKPEEFEGFLRSQKRYDTQQMPIETFDRETLLRRAETWNDPARTARANQFLENYSNELQKLHNAVIHGGLYPSNFEAQYKRIQKIITNLYNNEKAITEISKYMPDLNIALISGRLSIGDGEDNFSWSDIYLSWLVVEDSWLM